MTVIKLLLLRPVKHMMMSAIVMLLLIVAVPAQPLVLKQQGVVAGHRTLHAQVLVLQRVGHLVDADPGGRDGAQDTGDVKMHRLKLAPATPPGHLKRAGQVGDRVGVIVPRLVREVSGQLSVKAGSYSGTGNLGEWELKHRFPV